MRIWTQRAEGEIEREKEGGRGTKAKIWEGSFYLGCSTWFQGQLILKQQNIKLVCVCVYCEVCVCVSCSAYWHLAHRDILLSQAQAALVCILIRHKSPCVCVCVGEHRCGATLVSVQVEMLFSNSHK